MRIHTWQTIDLCGAWRFAYAKHPAPSPVSMADAQGQGLAFYPCAVPGNFETDLHAAGLAPEPFFGMNPEQVRAMAEDSHAYYGRPFTYEPKEGLAPHLVFEGLDCYADVYLNGQKAASFDNMLVPRSLDASPYLLPGSNEVFLHILPAVRAAQAYEYPQLPHGNSLTFESLYVRKAAHMYGWDIMPRFLSAGMYRPAYVELRPAERIEDLYLKTAALRGGGAVLDLHYRLRTRLDGVYELDLSLACGTQRASSRAQVRFDAGLHTFTLSDAQLWHTRGRGPQNLYDVTVTLLKDGAALDICRFRTGVRTVALERTDLTTPEGAGEFVFRVNGEKVFCKGSNWVPVDAFHSRDRARIPAVFDMVRDLNCNMLRCWGGNVYEDDLFYQLCDESGVLVWQDFSMACALYPQDDAFAARLGEEAALVIRRLRMHPSLALWAGDNECDQAYFWREGQSGRPGDNRLTREVLPLAVRLHDGARPYLPSSPHYGPDVTADNRRYASEDHLWGPRNYYKSAFYVTSPCHFVSEIGYHGCPAPSSVARFISPHKLWPPEDNEEWLLHATSMPRDRAPFDYRVALMRKQVAELFREQPDNLEDFSFASQAVQAEAKKFFIERFRMGKWRTTGILWWNLMDGWPQFSDAVVDYYFEKKLAYGFIKNVQKDVCVSLTEPDGWQQLVVLLNDTPRDAFLQVRVTDIDTLECVFSGAGVARADASTPIGAIDYPRNRQRMLQITWTGEAAGENHYLSGEPPFSLSDYRRWVTALRLA